MTNSEHIVAWLLARCRFAPATWDKKFARSMGEWAEHRSVKPLSPKQREMLWKLAHKYRRQLEGMAGNAIHEVIGAHQRAASEWEQMSGERRGFESKLSFDPHDWLTRSVYADWLEEIARESEAAFAQRWMALHQRAPTFTGAGVSYGTMTLPINFEWMWNLGSKAWREESASHLPGDLQWAAKTWHKTRMAAESALARGLATLGITTLTEVSA